jgi:hypothetical protein
MPAIRHNRHPAMSQPAAFDESVIAALDDRLNDHPLYAALQSLDDLRQFMGQHVYAVWDFMSLLKYLQSRIAPAAYPWKPHGTSSARFFINQIVLAEESDEGLPDAAGQPTHVSHFELYCEAMREIGADPADAIRFADIAGDQGFDDAMALGTAPAAAAEFMRSTFGFIATDKPHVVGAAFALGREHIIPEMFRAFLKRMNITRQAAPAFHYYLERHIHLDEDLHAPLAKQMVNELIGGDPAKLREAEAAAEAAVSARIGFWDGVLAELTSSRQRAAA